MLRVTPHVMTNMSSLVPLGPHTPTYDVAN